MGALRLCGYKSFFSFLDDAERKTKLNITFRSYSNRIAYLGSMLLSEITGKKILISPLDWGMGHTTRCVALIQKLIKENELIFAGNKSQTDFITREFPGLKTLFLEGYNVSLDSKKSSYLQLLLQISKIKKAIKAEHRFAKRVADEEKIDLIISDNRYGLYSSKTKNILLTHQLNLQIPAGRNLVNKRLKSWIEKFDVCWIPDSEHHPLCGELLNADLKCPKVFIGPLVRFENVDAPFRYEYLFIASGPEPERSRFAKQICDYLVQKKVHFAVAGFMNDNVGGDYFIAPTTRELQMLLNTSEKVISRSGYTTIMELSALNKKAILIPTNGQYEQQYLANTVTVENLTFIDEKRFFNDDLL